MMKVKKFMALSLGLASAGFLAACAGNETTGTGAPIRIMTPVFGDTAPEENNDIQQSIEYLTGFEMDITWVPVDSYGDRLSIVMASGEDMPEVLVIPGGDYRSGTITSGVNTGAFWNLDPFLDEFPYLAQMNPDVRMNASFNGYTYGLFRARDLVRQAIIIRRDWLDNLGMSNPTTIDELTEVLFAFRDNDPDGNGIDDTYGLIVPNFLGTFDLVQLMFGAPNGTKIDVDGNVVFDFMTEEYMQALEWLRMLHAEGIMNSDFITKPAEDWNNDFVNDRAGMIIDTQSRGMQISNLMRDANGVDDGSPWVTMVGTVEGPRGKFIEALPGFNGAVMIPTVSVQTEERLREVLTFLNALNSEEMHTKLHLGIEDVHWTFNADGQFETIRPDDEAEVRQINANIASFAQIGMMGAPGQQLPFAVTGHQIETERITIRDGEYYHNIAVFNPTLSFVSETEQLRSAILGNIIPDARVQFIAGIIDRAGFEAEVQRWLDSGGQDIIEELTALYHASQN